MVSEMPEEKVTCNPRMYCKPGDRRVNFVNDNSVINCNEHSFLI